MNPGMCMIIGGMLGALVSVAIVRIRRALQVRQDMQQDRQQTQRSMQEFRTRVHETIRAMPAVR